MNSTNFFDILSLKYKLNNINTITSNEIYDFIEFKNNNKYLIVIGIGIAILIILPFIVKKIINISSNQSGGGFLGLTITDVYKLLMILIIFFILIGFVSLRKLSLYCYGCSRGSWWYKCLSGTGYGTSACNTSNNMSKHMKNLLNILFRVIRQTKTIHTSISSVFKTITTLIGQLKNYLMNAISIPSFNIPKIDENTVDGLRCAIYNVDLCTPFREGIKGVIKTINGSGQAFNIFTNALISACSKILELIGNMIRNILSGITIIFKQLFRPIKESFRIILLIKDQIVRIINIISDVGIINIILFNLINIITSIIKSFTSNSMQGGNNKYKDKNNTITIGTALVFTITLFCILFIFPMIGGIYLGIRSLISIIMLPLNILFSLL